jgi:hypothetical protein
MLDGPELLIVGGYGCIETLNCGYTEGVSVRKGMHAFDLGCRSHKRVIDRHQFKRQLFQ